MASAFAVAERFRELSGGTLTPLQLLKLVYIAHGWSFALRDKALIRERVEAWQYGPVIPDLYHALKSFRADPVTSSLSHQPLEVDEQELVDKVFEVYGRYSGGQLSSMTHRPGTPWDVAWNRGKNSQITDDMIASHYRRLNEERNVKRA